MYAFWGGGGRSLRHFLRVWLTMSKGDSYAQAKTTAKVSIRSFISAGCVNLCILKVKARSISAAPDTLLSGGNQLPLACFQHIHLCDFSIYLNKIWKWILILILVHWASYPTLYLHRFNTSNKTVHLTRKKTICLNSFPVISAILSFANSRGGGGPAPPPP